MGHIRLHQLQRELSADPVLLSNLTLHQIFSFITLISRLKDDIILTQPAHMSASTAPAVLPPAIVDFIASCCNLTEGDVDRIWEVLRDTIWHQAHNYRQEDTMAAFTEHGHEHGLTFYTLFPPQHHCTSTDCPRSKRGLLLKKAESRQAVLFTLNDGAIPIYSTHLSCPKCRINYHHNFYVHNDRRIHYDTIPDIIQVGEHMFAERKLISLWINLMLISWTSATNCAHLYNAALSHAAEAPHTWPFALTVSANHVWTGFITLSLLEDYTARQETLIVPHGGLQKDRFTSAVQARNARFRLYGQPELRHHCNKCLRLYVNENGDATKVWVVVIDGITIGHTCCAIHNCFVPLASHRDRFCPVHTNTHANICAIIGCSNPIVEGSLACADREHQEAEHTYRERGKARFQLQERLERARVARPNDAISGEHPLADEDEFEIPSTHLAAKPKKLRAQFGRKRTHNEQIIVAPCGIIIARETFYGAEGIGSVIEMIKHTFRGDIKPDHIFFDNNCSLAKAVRDDDFFRDIGLTVDVFHFKSKHSETDLFCQTYCNPAGYPELLSADGWYFNSSIAEQTNVWLGGYHSICREMLVDKYSFFLDEMIMRKNRLVRAKLDKEMHMPTLWPM